MNWCLHLGALMFWVHIHLGQS